jgi:uncharacterized protein YdeI (YjbR/CyaY-like superfamily)
LQSAKREETKQKRIAKIVDEVLDQWWISGGIP